MSQHLTADLIAQALDAHPWLAFDVGGMPGDNVTFDSRGEGRVLVTLWRRDEDTGYDVEVEARTFRIVEVES